MKEDEQIFLRNFNRVLPMKMCLEPVVVLLILIKDVFGIRINVLFSWVSD